MFEGYTKHHTVIMLDLSNSKGNDNDIVLIPIIVYQKKDDGLVFLSYSPKFGVYGEGNTIEDSLNELTEQYAEHKKLYKDKTRLSEFMEQTADPQTLSELYQELSDKDGMTFIDFISNLLAEKEKRKSIYHEFSENKIGNSYHITKLVKNKPNAKKIEAYAYA